MKRMISLGLGLALMTASGAAFGKSVDRKQEEAALRALDLEWSAAANRKDVDATVAYMASDGETLPPNGPAARDAAAIRKTWAGLIGSPGFVSIDWKPLRVQVAESGDMGFSSGSYTLTINDAAGKPMTDRGKYLEVWKKIDGKWKCLADMYSSDLPAQ